MEVWLLCYARKAATGDAAHYISSACRLHPFSAVASSERFSIEDTSWKRQARGAASPGQRLHEMSRNKWKGRQWCT
jgi:hypothetical protein